MLVAPSDGAIMAAPNGATVPSVEGSERVRISAVPIASSGARATWVRDSLRHGPHPTTKSSMESSAEAAHPNALKGDRPRGRALEAIDGNVAAPKRRTGYKEKITQKSRSWLRKISQYFS